MEKKSYNSLEGQFSLLSECHFFFLIHHSCHPHLFFNFTKPYCKIQVQSSTYAFETLLNISSISSMRNHGPPFFGFYCPFESLHAGKLDLVVHEGFLHHVVFIFKWGRETISLFEIKVG